MSRTVALAPLIAIAALLAPPASTQSFLVSGFSNAALLRYDFATGAPLGSVAAAPGAQSLRYGPDGFLYACAEEQDRVLKLDGQTGAFVANFVWDDPATPADETGGLDAPTAAIFAPDGALLVASFSQDRVLRYDGATGAFLGELIAPGTNNLNGPDAGMCFGPDGRLYVPSFNNNRILRFEADGTFVDVFANALDGLSRPRVLRFRGDGLLYVTSWGNNRIVRFGLDGAVVDTLVTGVVRPTGLLIDPESGDLLVTSDQEDDVKRFDGVTGAAEGVLVAAGSGGLDGGTFLEWLPDRELHLARLWPGTAGGSSVLDIAGGPANGIVFLIHGFGTQASAIGPGAKAWIGVQPAGVLPLLLDGAGRLHLDVAVPPELAGVQIVLQAYDAQSVRSSNLVIQAIP
jgi:DNA-binding beta-propeller fold protein YncE